MTAQAILLPLFVEVILTFVLLFWLAPLRARDFSRASRGRTTLRLREPNWSPRTLQVGIFILAISSNCPSCFMFSRFLPMSRISPASCSWCWPGFS